MRVRWIGMGMWRVVMRIDSWDFRISQFLGYGWDGYGLIDAHPFIGWQGMDALSPG